jgi:hypothetical protein
MLIVIAVLLFLILWALIDRDSIQWVFAHAILWIYVLIVGGLGLLFFLGVPLYIWWEVDHGSKTAVHYFWLYFAVIIGLGIWIDLSEGRKKRAKVETEKLDSIRESEHE